MDKKPLILLVITALLCAFPAIFIEGEYGGTDGVVEEIPTAVQWFSPVFEPMSGEIESLLFCVQVAIGALIIGYYIGRWQAENSQT